ncbi:MAG: hypothetical protein R2867_02455 [Caldilineaceae bacterium]
MASLLNTLFDRLRSYRFWHNADAYSILVVVIYVGFLSVFGLVETTIVNSATLVMLTLVGLALLKISLKVDELDKNLKIGSYQVRKFNNSTEALEYVAELTDRSDESIVQASLGVIPVKSNYPGRPVYEKARNDKIKANQVRYQYVAALYDTRRLDQMEAFIASDLHNFHMKAYVQNPNDIPLVDFTIFDQKEIFMGYPNELGVEREFVSIRGEEIVKFYLKWFDRLWSEGKAVRTKDDVDKIRSQVSCTKSVS